MDQTTGLWKGNFDDRSDGSIFKLGKKIRPNSEEALTVSLILL